MVWILKYGEVFGVVLVCCDQLVVVVVIVLGCCVIELEFWFVGVVVDCFLSFEMQFGIVFLYDVGVFFLRLGGWMDDVFILDLNVIV